MKHIKEYKVYESFKEEVPYSEINSSEYSELIGDKVPFSLLEKKILMDLLFFYQKNVSEYQIQFFIREDNQNQKNVIFYDIDKVNDEWFLVRWIKRGMFKRQSVQRKQVPPAWSKYCWVKCDQFDGLLEFLKFKKIIK